jgi:hypothetical protein
LPQPIGDQEWIDSDCAPPRAFVASLMILPVVGSAQGNHELVAGLSSHRARLGKPKMVGVSGASPADQARL